MNRLERRVVRDLRQIADRATPSPDAWDSILARIADRQPATETEIIMLTETAPTRTRRWSPFAMAAAVVALIVAGIALFARDDSSSRPGDTPSSSAPRHAGAPTTDVEIATAALLDASDVGSLWTADGFPAVSWSPVLAPDPQCAAYRDSVFVNNGVPATVGTRTFLNETAEIGFQQTVLVFPQEAAATAMMDATRQMGFPYCWVSYVIAASNPAYHESSEAQVAEPPSLQRVGDDLEVVASTGTIVSEFGTRVDDQRRTAFMRVGRAVVIVDPPYAALGVTDDELVEMLTVAADRLGEAQR